MYLKTCRICMCAQCAYWVQCRERLLLMHQRNSKMHEMAHLVFATSEYMHTPAVAHCTLSSLHFAYREKWFIVCAVRRIVHTMQEISLTSIYIEFGQKLREWIDSDHSIGTIHYYHTLGAIIIIDSRIHTLFYRKRLYILRHCINIRCAPCTQPMHTVLAFKFQHARIIFMGIKQQMEIPTNNPEKWFRMDDSKKYFSALKFKLYIFEFRFDYSSLFSCCCRSRCRGRVQCVDKISSLCICLLVKKCERK